MSGRFWEEQSPHATYSADSPPPEVQANPLANWRWERTLPETELAAIIAKELEREGHKVQWESFLKDVRERQSRQEPRDLAEAKRAYLELGLGKPGTEPTNRVPGHPSILLKDPNADKPKRPKKAPISKVSDAHPIAFETTHYPLNKELYSPFRTRKVTLYLKLSALNLPLPVRERFLALTEWHPEQAGVLAPRYDPEKDLLTLKSRSARTSAGNRRLVLLKLKRMLAAAWPADLGYLPPPAAHSRAELAPHEQIALEIEEGHKAAMKAEQLSFERVKELSRKGPIIFRLSASQYPSPAALEEGRARARALIERIRADL